MLNVRKPGLHHRNQVISFEGVRKYWNIFFTNLLFLITFRKFFFIIIFFCICFGRLLLQIRDVLVTMGWNDREKIDGEITMILHTCFEHVCACVACIRCNYCVLSHDLNMWAVLRIFFFLFKEGVDKTFSDMCVIYVCIWNRQTKKKSREKNKSKKKNIARSFLRGRVHWSKCIYRTCSHL